MRSRVDVSTEPRLATHEDTFAISAHVSSADGPFDELSVEVNRGEIQNPECRSAFMRAPSTLTRSLFLRDTTLAQATHDAELRPKHPHRQKAAWVLRRTAPVC